jgi:cbb3-type cytochrome oxidase subunit 3
MPNDFASTTNSEFELKDAYEDTPVRVALKKRRKKYFDKSASMTEEDIKQTKEDEELL